MKNLVKSLIDNSRINNEQALTMVMLVANDYTGYVPLGVIVKERRSYPTTIMRHLDNLMNEGYLTYTIDDQKAHLCEISFSEKTKELLDA